MRQDLQPSLRGLHLQVTQNKLVFAFIQLLNGLGCTGSGIDVIAARFQYCFQGQACGWIVIDEQYGLRITEILDGQSDPELMQPVARAAAAAAAVDDDDGDGADGADETDGATEAQGAPEQAAPAGRSGAGEG